MLARWCLFLLASGQLYFVGVVCLLFGVALGLATHHRGLSSLRNLLSVGGFLLIGAAATPWPWPIYLTVGLVTLIWLVGERRGSGWISVQRRLMMATWMFAGLYEATYQVVPMLPPLSRPILGIIGDSLTAGTDDVESANWPERLSALHGIEVHSHAVAGATVRSALSQVKTCTEAESLILLEIGGSDLFGGTSTRSFEADLAQLIKALRRPGRTILMLELPLIPGLNQFGIIQRRLAADNDLILVPKRILVGVLMTDGATLDTVHLSSSGHDLMAAVI